MHISRLDGVAAACLAVTAASACGSDPAADASSSFGECELTGEPGQYELETVEPDVLTIKADVPSVGWWDGNTVEDIKSGYEYCMAAEIAYRSGLKSVDLQYVSFDGLVPGQLTGDDLSLDETSITPERAEIVDFSDPYYTSSIGVLTKKRADVTEANLSGLRLGVKQGTAGQQWAADTLDPEHLDVFPGDSEARDALTAGRIDAYPVLGIVRDLADERLTMLLATHEMSFAREVASTVCFLHEGVILEQGPPEQIFGAPTEPRTQAFLRRIIEAGRL
jgi:polar amino acid transport system substrate-binding protein